jgi:membrane protein required for colicin V production
MPALTALDIIVLLLVVGGGVLGILRGFVTEVLSLFAWVAAIAAIKVLHPTAADLLAGAGGDARRRIGAGLRAHLPGRVLRRQDGRRARLAVAPSSRSWDRSIACSGLGFGALKGLIGRRSSISG